MSITRIKGTDEQIQTDTIISSTSVPSAIVQYAEGRMLNRSLSAGFDGPIAVEVGSVKGDMELVDVTTGKFIAYGSGFYSLTVGQGRISTSPGTTEFSVFIDHCDSDGTVINKWGTPTSNNNSGLLVIPSVSVSDIRMSSGQYLRYRIRSATSQSYIRDTSGSNQLSWCFVKKLDSTMEKLNFSLGVEVRVVPNTISSSGNHFLTFEKAQSYGNADMVSNDGTKILILEDGWYHVKGPFLAPVPSLVKNNIFALFIYKNGEGGLNRIDGTVLNWGGAETGIPGVGWSSGMTGAGLTRYFKAGDYLRMSLYTMVDSSLTSINNVDEDNMAMASVVRIGGVEIPRVEVYDNSLELYPGLGMTGKVVWGTRSVPTAWSYDGTMVGVAGQASMIQGNKIVVPESGYYMFTAISPGNITPPLPNVPAASSRVLNVVTSSSGFNWYIYTPSEFSNQEVLGGTFFGWFNQGETLTVGLKVELNGYSVSNPWNTSTALPDMKFNFCKVGTLRSDTIEKAKAYWVKVKAPAGAGATTESGNTVPYQFVDGTATMISGGAFVVPRTGFYSFSGGRMKISSSLYDDVVINLYIGDTWDNESTIYDNHFRWGNVKCNTFPSINAMCYLEANQRVKVYYGGTTNTLPAPSFPGVEVEHFITMREML